MSVLVVTVTGRDASGRTVSGTATAEVRPRHGVAADVEAARLLALAGLVERHAAAFRRDLERFMTGEPSGFGWFRRDGSEGSGM